MQHVGNEELALSCLRRTMPGAKVQPAHGVRAACGTTAVEMSGRAMGLAAGWAREGAAGKPELPAVGSGASRGWGRS